MALLASLGGLLRTSNAFDFNNLDVNDGVVDLKMHRANRESQQGADLMSLIEYPDKDRGTNIDVKMDMMYDLNHYIVLKTKDNSEGLYLIPSTGLSELVIMHESCDTCMSYHNAKWAPDWQDPVGGASIPLTEKRFSYVNMLHVYDCKAKGHYWRMNACLDSKSEACATDLFFYGVHEADPAFHSLADGYFGLSPSKGIAGSKSMSAFDQIFDRGMVKKKIIGVHTHLYNSTEAPSEMRFGGYNEELFKEGHEQVWLNTTNPTMSWVVKFDYAGFHSESLWEGKHALIDPGYPFIGMPFSYFKDFEADLALKYPEHPINCTREDWCQFDLPCSEVKDDMPDLTFSFPAEHHLLDTVIYKVPAKSFLFDD